MALQRVKGSIWNSADNLVVEVLTDLGNLPDTAQEGCITVLGHTAANDGGGGVFQYVAATARSTANNGTIIDATNTGVGNGCWHRIYALSEGSLAWFGSSDDDRTNLTQARGVEGLYVTVVDGNYSGRFQFRAAEVANHDGVNNFNGWVRVNDVRFTSNIIMHDNRVTGLADAVDDGDAVPLSQVNALLDTVVTNQQYVFQVQLADQDYIDYATLHNGIAESTQEESITKVKNAFIHVNGQDVDKGRLSATAGDYWFSDEEAKLYFREGFPVDTVLTFNWLEGNASLTNPGLETIEETGATLTLSSTHIDKIIKCTNAAGCVITVPAGLSTRFTCLVHEAGGVGDVTFSLAGGVTLTPSTGFVAEVFPTGWAAIMGDTDETPDTFYITGDLNPAP